MAFRVRYRPVIAEEGCVVVARLVQVRPLVTLDEDGTGRVEVQVRVERAPGGAAPLEVRLTLGDPGDWGSTSCVMGAGDTTVTLALTVPEAPVWWPVGYGGQPLVGLVVTLSAEDELDRYQRRIGFRSVRVQEPVDEDGTVFGLTVNGRAVFVKGVVWSPEAVRPQRLTRRDRDAVVGRVVAANVNLLRIRGEGPGESLEFYEACDEQGVLVWQDTPRPDPHPSLVVCGGDGRRALSAVPAPEVPGDRQADRQWESQLRQARATTFAVDQARARAPRTGGCVIGTDDGIPPDTSWALVDGENRPLPAWFALRRACAPRLLSLRPDGEGGLGIAVVNDSDEPFRGHLTLRRITFGGAVVAGVSLAHDVAAWSTQLLAVPRVLATPGDPAAETLVAEAGFLRATYLFARDPDLSYAPAPVRTSARRLRDGYAVTVTAQSFTRDVTLLAGHAHPDAAADEALVSLLAGESHTFLVRAPGPLALTSLTGPPVVRSANEVRRAPSGSSGPSGARRPLPAPSPLPGTGRRGAASE
ncbi:hypothetical protein GCM10022223_70390 [Kineosporia mesophila]|uniref:Glycoside hydrolase family 2 immunoglobulin-like beta-sandwich domain-containing protein n=1 Tax=Kineosporia mesophila TaxID=566012 RepID=A0ABP7AVS1_9ACTN|nr:hypothetical protein [Kineosporia mesophila]MCD5354127.1 hypothetical protein [Kineosporia mesophila]